MRFNKSSREYNKKEKIGKDIFQRRKKDNKDKKERRS